MKVSESSVAADLYQICIDSMPESGIDIAKALYQRSEKELQLRVCDVLEKEDDLSVVSGMVMGLMEKGSTEVRVRALRMLKNRGCSGV